MSAPQPPWKARTGTEAAPDLVAYGESTDTDAALIGPDLAGSVAHVLGLHAADLLTHQETTTLVEGLQALAEEAADDGIVLDPALEDVHMNVEHLLGEAIGPVADKLHTARSRNDQVALDIRLATREGLAAIAEATHALATELAQLAGEHAHTPWPLHTHGLPGQPATLGYLLHAHALRFTRALEHQLALFDELDESPLGAGAGAGTTLPIDPAVPATLLGLTPPENGLLATGARDGSIQAAHAAAEAGRLAQDLVVDLLDLAQQGAIELPAAYTTGSSIMPHKQNPDALELARADGAKLAHLADETEAIASGLGLGYDRDLQRAKPPLLEALTTAPTVLAILTALVEEITVDEDALAAQQTAAIATTDAAETLVEHGVPFRQAHQAVSQACQAAEDPATSIADGLQQVDAPTQALEAAAEALTPDPALRDTPGGPAPARVSAALTDLEAQLTTLEHQIGAAQDAAQAPYDLLEIAPEQLIAKTPEASS